MKPSQSIASLLGRVDPSLEVMITPELFRRRFVVWKPEHLVMPPTPLINQFEFPNNAVYHYVVMDGIQEGPSPTDVKLATIDKKITIEAVRQLTSSEGKPAPIAVNIQSSVDAWHRYNKRFRKSRDAVAEAPSEQTLAIINYAFLPQLYRYTRSIYTDRYRWVNTWATVFNKINEISQTSTRTNFIFVDMPQQLPSMQRLEALTDKPDAMIVRTLPTPEDWMLYELWKWVDPEKRGTSLLNRIDPLHYDKVRLVIQDAGRFICLDLGLLNQWLRDPTGSKESTGRLKPVELQKRLLRGLMGLMQNRVPVILDENTGDIDQTAIDAQQQQNDASTSTNVGDTETTAQRVERILAELDDDIAQLDTNDAQRMKMLEEGVISASQPASVETTEEVSFDKPVSPVDMIRKQADNLDNMGVLAPSEYRKILRLLDNGQKLKDPFGGDKTLVEFGTVTPDETLIKNVHQLPDSVTIIDKSMREASLKDFDSKYIDQFLRRDTVGCVAAMQKAGMIISDYQVEVNEDALGKYELHSVRFSPLVGLPTTLRFKLPVPDSSGKIKSGGTDYRFRKQRVDAPIRKISASRVAISSYYGKSFVSRSERSTYDYGRWLQREVMVQVMGENPTITNIKTGDVFYRECTGPRSFTAMSERYREFTFQGINFNFDWSKQKEIFGDEAIAEAKTQNLTLCGKDANALYALDVNNTLYKVEPGNSTPVESFEVFLGLEALRAPLEFTECRIMGKNIPTGVVLAYYYGLSTLIKMLGASVRRVGAGQRQNLQPNEWSVAFEDETLIFNRDDRLATLILAGFRSVEKSTKRYSIYAFDKQAVYLNVLEQQGLSVRYLRELDNLDKLFVDPITERVLKRMGEPTTYRGLIKRASEMLLLDEHPRLLDVRYMRWRGMERIAGSVYTEMVRSVREHGSLAGRSNAHLKLNVYSVWKAVMQDQSMTQVKDINPINDLKEIEATTYAGAGGRSSRSLTRSARYFDPTDLGVTSEATSDSKDVAINTYTSASPRFDSLEGTVMEPLYENTPTTSILSTSALVSPFSTNEDSKRTNFISIQQGHGIPCDNYKVSPVRTGFEETIAHKVGENFAATAKMNGKVTRVRPNGILVQYADGSTQGFEIGRRFGNASGMTIPHDLVSNFKEGDSFNAGDVLTYHKGFFKPDRFNPSQVRWMNGTICTVALLESRQTHEDACSLSSKFAGSFGTRMTAVKRVVVNFDQQVHSLVNVGDHVSYSSSLCVIEDSIGTDTSLFTDETLNTLKALSGQSPRAKVTGRVDNIEVFYHGDKEDMSESLRSLADVSDRRMADRRRSVGKAVFTGQVDEGYRIEGEPLLLDTAVIVVYITHTVGAGVGDKFVFGNQLKTVVSEVMDYPVTAKNGIEIDAIFGAKSIFDRIVPSPFLIGTTTTLLGIIGKNTAKIFKGN